MTAILWKNDQLIVDSLSQNNVEWFQDAGKVAIVRWELFWQDSNDDPGDPILGLTYTGARRTAEAFSECLRKACHKVMGNVLDRNDVTQTSHDIVLSAYQQSVDLDLVNEENSCTVLLIGLRYNYIFDISPGSVTVGQRSKDCVIVLGSGSDLMTRFDQMHGGKADPIRMQHYAELMGGQCGGRLYIYQVLPDPTTQVGHRMALVGLCEPISQFLLNATTVLPEQEYVPDLVLNKDAGKSFPLRGRIKPAGYWTKYVKQYRQVLRRQKKTTRSTKTSVRKTAQRTS